MKMCFGKGHEKTVHYKNLAKHTPYWRQWVADGLRRLLVELVPLSEAPLTDLLKLDALSVPL